MTDRKVLVVIGGTSGIGHEIARRAADRGQTVILSGRDADHARQMAAEIGGDTRGIAVDLSRPRGLATQLAGIDRVDHLVLTAMARDQNTVRTYNASTAIALVTMKLVGYTQVIHLLRSAMPDGGAIVVSVGWPRTVRTRALRRCPRSTPAWWVWCTRWPPSYRRSGSTRSSRAWSGTAQGQPVLVRQAVGTGGFPNAAGPARDDDRYRRGRRVPAAQPGGHRGEPARRRRWSLR